MPTHSDLRDYIYAAGVGLYLGDIYVWRMRPTRAYGYDTSIANQIRSRLN